MKKTLLIFISFILLMHCKPQQVLITNIEWKLTKLEGRDVSSLNPPVTLLLDESQKKVSGYAGCNRFFGSYQSENTGITFSGMGSTKMFCQETMPIEDAYFKALGNVQAFKTTDNQLHLMAGNKVVLEFSRP